MLQLPSRLLLVYLFRPKATSQPLAIGGDLSSHCLVVIGEHISLFNIGSNQTFCYNHSCYFLAACASPKYHDGNSNKPWPDLPHKSPTPSRSSSQDSRDSRSSSTIAVENGDSPTSPSSSFTSKLSNLGPDFDHFNNFHDRYYKNKIPTGRSPALLSKPFSSPPSSNSSPASSNHSPASSNHSPASSNHSPASSYKFPSPSVVQSSPGPGPRNNSPAPSRSPTRRRE